MRINIRRYVDTGERVAIVMGGRKYGARKYNITDTSLARVESLAIQTTTRQYHMIGHDIEESDHLMRKR